MQHTTTPNLVRFHMHLRRDHTQRLTQLANGLARKNGRDVRLGEALELALTAGFAWDDNDLLDLAPTDRQAPHWRLLGPINRQGCKALTPTTVRMRDAVQ